MMSLRLCSDELKLPNNDIRFTNRPKPIPLGYRISYVMSQISLLLLLNGGRTACSMTKIQIIISAMRDKYNFEELEKFSNNTSFCAGFLIRFDPAINRAISFGIRDGIFIRQSDEKIKLTKKGKRFCEQILKEQVMLNETLLLNKIGLHLTEHKIEIIHTYWGTKHAENK